MLGAESLANVNKVLAQKLKIDIQLKLTSPPGRKGTILVPKVFKKRFLIRWLNNFRYFE